MITTKPIEDDKISVTVADTGCGIPDEIFAKIRDPFFTTKEVGVGTGLGLSIVEKIVGAHAGVLDIKSEVGKGSAFTVTLAVNPPIDADGKPVDKVGDASSEEDSEEAVAVAS